MIECLERNKQILVPVFFNVDPSDVRQQHGEYGDALAKHEEKLKENMFKVQSWRSALKKAANLSGFHYPGNFDDESDLVDKIVEDISEKLSKSSPSESNGLVGNDQNIVQIQSLLLKESNEVIFVGIWGMGGIGKTTIAHAMYDKYSPQYEGCCFLNVREEVEQRGLSHLQEKLISELLEGEGLHTSGTSKARFFDSAGRKMGRKKVLVVLDDVNTSEQLKYLVGKPICFGPGSRVLITSRDKRVLTSGGVYQIHKVKEMDPRDSLKLFCLNAFNESHPKMGYEKLSEEVVKIAQGNPLALKVLGADFHSRSMDTWECALSKIKKYPNEEIQSVLRFSYDGLHEVEKKAFLDIAFFFEEDDKDYVTRKLDAWGFHGASGVEVLQQKALITISDNRIQMHDLIREMGCEIVRQESIICPRRRSRLRDNEEVSNVLRQNLGTDEVEAMQIDVSGIKNLPLKLGTFKKMPRLRFLKFYLPLHAELSLLQSHDGPIWSPEKQDELLLSAGCKQLMRVASEIHIKCLHYLLIDDCSDPSLLDELTSTEMSMLQNIAQDAGVEIILNSSIGQLSSLECSDVVDQQFKNLPNELLCLRCTYYLKLSKSRQQDIGKPKLHILFDSLRYYQRISVSQLYKPVVVFPPKSRAEMWLKGAKKEVKGFVVATFYIHLYTVLFFLSPSTFSITIFTQTITLSFLLFCCILLSFFTTRGGIKFMQE
ncbi:TIR-NBS-LRR type disease resistance protein [Glycine max]|nr:TIR-NBS-LRR type disease resistance protein [Glycine max]ACM89620.1 TIR-NBS-LRR type disease resistance protein [Glycine max]|eukprot:NP_001235633.1 TIR-NBS-LRR type disease resistance protein [Glycine max]